jgi:hypothetical protein
MGRSGRLAEVTAKKAALKNRAKPGSGSHGMSRIALGV